MDCVFERDSRRRRTVVVDIADETKPAPVKRANEALVVAAVAERAPCRADPGAQRRLRDDAPLPNRVEQLVLADEPVAVPNEMNQQVEYLRLDVNNHTSPAQLSLRDIDFEIGESKVQSKPSC